MCPLQVAVRHSLLERVHRLHPVLPAGSHFELPSHGLSLSVPDRIVAASAAARARLDKVLAVEPGEQNDHAAARNDGKLGQKVQSQLRADARERAVDELWEEWIERSATVKQQ